MTHEELEARSAETIQKRSVATGCLSATARRHTPEVPGPEMRALLLTRLSARSR